MVTVIIIYVQNTVSNEQNSWEAFKPRIMRRQQQRVYQAR